jgi:hypothetical protein
MAIDSIGEDGPSQEKIKTRILMKIFEEEIQNRSRFQLWARLPHRHTVTHAS